MSLTEIETVFGEEGRNDFVVDVFFELILSHELRVDDSRSAVSEPVFRDLFMAFQKHVNCRISVAVDDQLHIIVIDELDELFGLCFRKQRFAAPILFAAWSTRQVGGRELSSSTLGRSVERNLDPGEF